MPWSLLCKWLRSSPVPADAESSQGRNGCVHPRLRELRRVRFSLRVAGTGLHPRSAAQNALRLFFLTSESGWNYWFQWFVVGNSCLECTLTGAFSISQEFVNTYVFFQESDVAFSRSDSKRIDRCSGYSSGSFPALMAVHSILMTPHPPVLGLPASALALGANHYWPGLHHTAHSCPSLR